MPKRATNIKQIIPLILVVILLKISGCVTNVNPSNYVPEIPDRPELSEAPQFTSDEKHIVIPAADWELIRQWYLKLELELQASCLALGNSKKECKI